MPDPPPLVVAPEPPPVATTAPEAVRRTPTSPKPVARRAVPTVARPAPAAASRTAPAATRVSRPAAAKGSLPVNRLIAPRPPHDRDPVPLVAFVAGEAAFDRGLLALAGALLGLITLGGGFVLQVARRTLEGSVA